MIGKRMRQRRLGSAAAVLAYITASEKARMPVFSPILRGLDVAAALMEAVAKGNRRVKKPFYHFVLAWPNADAPTEEQMVLVIQGALQRLGMLEHQWIAAVHDDAGHPHIHCLVNLVHPDTYRCASTSYDFFKLGQYATEVERQYGWLELRRYGAPGAKLVIGSLSFYERDLLPRSRANGRRLAPVEAAFQKWLRDEILAPLVTAVSSSGASWRIVLTEIARYGVCYIPSGSGGRFVDAVDSSISLDAPSMARVATLPRLEKYLGAFEDITVPIDVSHAFSRSAAVLGLSASDPYRKLLAQYRFEKRMRDEQARPIRRDAWATQRAKEVSQRARIRTECRDRLRGIRGEPKNMRLNARAQIVAAKKEALEKLKVEHNFEREKLRAQLSRAAKQEPWPKFVDRLVRDGNSTAIAYVQSTKRFAEADRTITLFSATHAKTLRRVSGEPTADDGGKALSFAPPDCAPREVKLFAVAPSEDRSIPGFPPAQPPVRSIPEDVDAVRLRLRRLGKPRVPRLSL